MTYSAITRSRTLAALVIACVMAVIFAQPATAQTAKKLDCKNCVKSKQLKNNGIKSKDIKDGQVGSTDLNATISIGTTSDDGDLSVKSTAGTPTVSLDGDTGTVANSLTGNGVVKAWAQIESDGTIIACYRCNMDLTETQQLGTGIYEVDFTPLGTDIRARPATAIADERGAFTNTFGNVSLFEHNGGSPIAPADFSSVIVLTRDNNANVDRSFTIIIF